MRGWLFVALLAGCALPGCNLLERTKTDAQAPKLKVAAPPPIRPEQVTPNNAVQKARELNEELDRELEGDGSV